MNSLHLKAVGIVFGPQKVLELLSLCDGEKDNNLINDKNGYRRNSKVIALKHRDLVTHFKDPEKGLENNEYLLSIEDASNELYEKVSDYLKTTHETAKIMKKQIQKKILSTKERKAQGD